MFEALIGTVGTQGGNELLLDINFEDRQVGSQGLTDGGKNSISFTRRVSGSAGTPDGVVDHPTIGKCYYFNGAVSFLANKILNVSKQAGDVVIELEFIPTASPSYMTLMFTGGFSAGQIGWNHYIQPTNRGNYSVLFVMQSSGNGGFISLITGLPAAVPLNGALVKERISFVKSTDTWTIANTNDGAAPGTSGVKKLFNDESILTIGSDNDPALGKFTGYVKSIKARVIVQ